MGGQPPGTTPRGFLRRGIETPLVVLLLLGGLGAGSVAQAQLKVRYPVVDYREVEIEHFSDITFDKPNSGKTNNQRYTNEYWPWSVAQLVCRARHRIPGAERREHHL